MVLVQSVSTCFNRYCDESSDFHLFTSRASLRLSLRRNQKRNRTKKSQKRIWYVALRLLSALPCLFSCKWWRVTLLPLVVATDIFDVWPLHPQPFGTKVDFSNRTRRVGQAAPQVQNQPLRGRFKVSYRANETSTVHPLSAEYQMWGCDLSHLPAQGGWSECKSVYLFAFCLV